MAGRAVGGVWTVWAEGRLWRLWSIIFDVKRVHFGQLFPIYYITNNIYILNLCFVVPINPVEYHQDDYNILQRFPVSPKLHSIHLHDSCSGNALFPKPARPVSKQDCR
jgi:hypothetical protein